MINDEWLRLRRRARLWWYAVSILATLAIISTIGETWLGWYAGFHLPRIFTVPGCVALTIAMRLGGMAIGYRWGSADMLSDQFKKTMDTAIE